MSSDAAKNAYPDPPEGFTMAGEEARLVGLREAYDRGARETDPFERDDVREALANAYDRGAREKAAEAWEEGANWAFEEITGGPSSSFLTIGDNPYEESGL